MDVFYFRSSQRPSGKNQFNAYLLCNPKFILYVIFFALLSLFFSEDCYSQNGKPDVLVTVIFAKETEACAPNGYASNYDYQDMQKKCDPLYFDKLSELGITIGHKLPPDEIPLKKLFRLVNWYSEKCTLDSPCKDADERYSIILGFEFQMPSAKGIEVSLKRTIPGELKTFFIGDQKEGDYSAKGILDEGGRWINHQRADLFLPGYGVEWELKAGEYSWKMLTTKGLQD